MIKAVLFDLDGTLLDTSEGITHSVRYTISTMGYSALSDETILKFVGPPIQESLMCYCGVDAEEAQKGTNVFRDFYKTNALFEASLYDGVTELLMELNSRNIKIGVATYKREDYAINLLKHFGIDNFCHVIHGADNENMLTKTDIVELCINEISVAKEDVVLVGDTKHDAIGAYQSGIKFIGVTYGFGFKSGDDVSYYPNIGYANNCRYGSHSLLSIFDLEK